MKRFNSIWLATWLLIVLLMVSGCSGANSNPLYLTIDNEPIYEDEVMLYILQTYNEFEQQGGEDVWEITDFSGGKSAGDVAKQGALDNLIMTKVLVKQASEMSMNFEDEDDSKLYDQSQQYFDNLPTSFVENYKITREVVRRVLKENRIALEVEVETKNNYEITAKALRDKRMENNEYVWLTGLIEQGIEGVLTNYRVQHMVFYTHQKNSDEQWVALDEESQVKAQARAQEAYEALLSGANYEDLALEYSQEEGLDRDNLTATLSMLQMPDVFAATLKSMENGEFSEVLQGDNGYHIFKLIDSIKPTVEEVETFSISFEQWTLALNEEAKETLIDNGFNNLYEKWRQSVGVKIEEPWSEVDIQLIGELAKEK